MIYDLTNHIDVIKFDSAVLRAKELKKVYEFKEKKKRRSLSQNAYLHLILSYFGCEYGEPLEYIKQEIFKKQVNPEIFKSDYLNKIREYIREDWRSTRDLDTSEMTIAIERFKNYSAKEGIPLPDANDHIFLVHCEKEIERNKIYL